MFHVGQKVVCVNDVWVRIWDDVECPLVKGEVYTIAGFSAPDKSIGPDRIIRMISGVILQEVSNPTAKRGEDCGFCPTRFRPLVEKKTDITVFTEMLRPVKEDA